MSSLFINRYSVVKRDADHSTYPFRSYESYTKEMADLNDEVLQIYEKIKLLLPEDW
jgi:hypothetical protein